MTSYFSGIFESFNGGLGLGLAILAILVGFFSLFFGRRFYWLFVGAAGFLLGLMFAPLLLANVEPAWHPWISLLVGVIFAFAAQFLNKVMVAIGGAIGLGSLVYLFTQANLVPWAVVLLSVVAAVIGFIFAWLLFDWGLIIFSSLAGAAMVTSGAVSLIPGIASADLIIFLALFIIGLIVQIRAWSRTRIHEEVVAEEPVIVDVVDDVDDDVVDE